MLHIYSFFQFNHFSILIRGCLIAMYTIEKQMLNLGISKIDFKTGDREIFGNQNIVPIKTH